MELETPFTKNISDTQTRHTIVVHVIQRLIGHVLLTQRIGGFGPNNMVHLVG